MVSAGNCDVASRQSDHRVLGENFLFSFSVRKIHFFCFSLHSDALRFCFRCGCNLVFHMFWEQHAFFDSGSFSSVLPCPCHFPWCFICSEFCWDAPGFGCGSFWSWPPADQNSSCDSPHAKSDHFPPSHENTVEECSPRFFFNNKTFIRFSAWNAQSSRLKQANSVYNDRAKAATPQTQTRKRQVDFIFRLAPWVPV